MTRRIWGIAQGFKLINLQVIQVKQPVPQKNMVLQSGPPKKKQEQLRFSRVQKDSFL